MPVRFEHTYARNRLNFVTRPVLLDTINKARATANNLSLNLPELIVPRTPITVISAFLEPSSSLPGHKCTVACFAYTTADYKSHTTFASVASSSLELPFTFDVPPNLLSFSPCSLVNAARNAIAEKQRQTNTQRNNTRLPILAANGGANAIGCYVSATRTQAMNTSNVFKRQLNMV